MKTLLLSLGMLLSLPFLAGAQAPPATPFVVNAVVEGTDTIPELYLDQVVVLAKLPARLAQRRIEWNRLKARVHKVYPYAVTAGSLMKGVDETLARIGDDKKARKAYLKDLEDRLNSRFKKELSDFTMSEGQILVKLISRETGRPCFHIIKEFKGGFSAFMFQSVAVLFNNNLKREYDPAGRDRDIEAIVQELETDNYWRYKARVGVRGV